MKTKKNILLLLCGLLWAVQLQAQFITTWRTYRANESITIPTRGNGYNYDVEWGDGDISYGQRGDATHTYAEAGTYTVTITGTFPRISFFRSNSRNKIMTIEQWGNNSWDYMGGAFAYCSNLKGNFTDAPNLSKVTNMAQMFQGASSFNHPIGDWDVSKVTSLSGMFDGASSFNQSLNDWDVSSVVYMSGMFKNARSFNQPLNNWNTSNVIQMYDMFEGARNFNQPLDNWDVSNVTNMRRIFSFARAFDQPLNNWDVSNATSMEGMFREAESFNQSLHNWEVSNVTNMEIMFQGAISFNQPVESWDVSNVESLKETFQNATSFNQSLNNWNVSKVSTMENMLTNTSLSEENYDALLIAWSEQELQDDVPFAISTTYCQNEASIARGQIIDDHNWTITDEGRNPECEDLPFITTWQTTEANESITIPTTGDGYNYTVDWGDGTITNNHEGNATHTYTNTGTYTVSITGDFPRIYFNNQGKMAEDNKHKIQTIEQWGNQQWISMESAFRGCSNLQGNFTDSPNLTNVTSLRSMFSGATSFNQSINDWDTSNVTDMSFTFYDATSFNQPLNDWDTSSVINMEAMFLGASSFNQPLVTWNVSNVTNLSFMFENASVFDQPLNNWDTSSAIDIQHMFSGANAFNQSLNNWDVSNVTNMSLMFYEASSFNQPLNDWDTSSVTQVRSMFYGATSFDQPLDNWDISNLTSMEGMLNEARMSTENYDALLIAWSEQTLQNDIQFDIDASYCSDAATEARARIINDYDWTINDEGKNCQELSVDDFAVSKTMLIYPNPAKAYVHIDNKSLQSEDNVSIIDMSGKVLHSVQVSEGRSHTTIDTSDLTSGLYWIQVVSQQTPSVYKLMIQ